MVEAAGAEVDKFVRDRWAEKEWETAWFVNPPVRSNVSNQIFERHINQPIHRGYRASRTCPIFTYSRERKMQK